jgi:Na+-transporting NADH:ubiquinone oxidoreductase subunit A
MSEVIKIKKGLDIRLQGKADNIYGKANLPDLFAIKPTDFHGVMPKMVVKDEGEEVKAGSVLFFDKNQPDVKFVSPVNSGFVSAPLAPDYDFILNGKEKEFQAGIDVLKKLCDDIHIGINNQAASKIYTSTKGVKLHRFEGPHPAGNVGIQIHQVMPLNKGEKIWALQPLEVATIGKLFTTGIHDFSRIIVVAGSEIKKPAYFHSQVGACISPYIHNNLNENENIRLISGNPLTGSQICDDGYLGFYHTLFTAIPEGDEYEFMGWAAPGFEKFSMSRSFFSWMRPNKRYRLSANMHGGKRAIVVSGQYEKVLPMDILPEQLFKSILIEDIDKMEQLGIYELAEEDVALCEFVCTSKMNLQKILRNGIELMIKELG